MADDNERLFGLGGDEHLDRELEDSVDRWEDRYMPEDGEDMDTDAPTEILEWSVQPVTGFLPSAASIIEWMDETACESGAGSEDCPFEGVDKDADVIAAAEALRVAMAAFCSWRWAKDIVARHPLTIVNGELHVDGEQFHKPKEITS